MARVDSLASFPTLQSLNEMPAECSHAGCTKVPSYGVDGTNKMEFCSQHKRDGMVDLRHKRCGHHGCSKQPSYGVEGTNKKEFCSQHKRDGMVDLKSKRCGHDGCSKVPSFGVEGTNNREFCFQHKRDGMVYRAGGSGRGRGGGTAAGCGVPVTRADSGKERRERPSSSLVSKGAEKRSRRSPADMPVAPIPGEPLGGEGLITADDELLSDSAGSATVKTEPGAFSIGRRGSWMRWVGRSVLRSVLIFNSPNDQFDALIPLSRCVAAVSLS